MSRIAIVTDTHFGARNDSPQFEWHYVRFFEEEFFPTLKKEGIKEIIHLGDIFDRRKYINFQTLAVYRKAFFDRLVEENLKMYVIAGNHDTYYKNTNEVNSIRLLLQEYITSGHIVLFDRLPEPRIIGGKNFLFVPWICDDNYDETLKIVSKSDADYCCAHLELEGFQMYSGVRCDDGLNHKLFKNFKRTFTGHFHTRSTEDNIFYLGSPYEFIWSDADDPRGFHILDTKTDELEFLENPKKIFYKLIYDEDDTLPEVGRFNNSCVKLVVTNRKDYPRFEAFINKFYEQNMIEFNILEDMSEFDEKYVGEDGVVAFDDTKELIRQYVDEIETDKDKARLLRLMTELFVEAQNLE